SQDSAAWPEVPPAGELRIGLRLVHPVDARIVEGAAVADRHLNPEPAIGTAALEHEHTALAARGQTICEHTARRAGADDDVIEDFHQAAELARTLKLRSDRGRSRQGNSFARSDGAQQIRSIRDDAIDSHVDEAAHVLRIVDGPDDDRQAETVCLGDRARGDILVERRPDLPARSLDGSRYRAPVLHRIEPRRPGRALVEV